MPGVSAPSVVVGRYRLDELVRREHDPSTWRGTDLSTNMPVLVCLVAGETGSAARTRRNVSHPGLLPVIDVVRMRDGVSPKLERADPRGDTFVVLQQPEGELLADLVARKGNLEIRRAARLVLAVSNALAAVQASGSVHGGVAPSAIEVRSLEDGGPRVGQSGVSDEAMAYSSPSRLCDGGPSVHDDAWALLGCLYFAIAGVAPFAAESPQALARRVLGGRPMPIRATTPAEVDMQKLFDRGFSRTASQRYPDVASLRDDIRSWLAAHADVADGPLLTQPPPAATFTATTARRPAEVAARASAERPSSDRPTEGAIPSQRVSGPVDVPPSVPPPPVHASSPETEGAIPSRRPTGAYPNVFPSTTTSARNQTVPWGSDASRPPTVPPPRKTIPFGVPVKDSGEFVPRALSSESAPGIAAPAPRPAAGRPPSDPSPPVEASDPGLTEREIPRARPSGLPPASDETARFSREQLRLIEAEHKKRSPLRSPPESEPHVESISEPPRGQAAPGTPRTMPAAAAAQLGTAKTLVDLATARTEPPARPTDASPPPAVAPSPSPARSQPPPSPPAPRRTGAVAGFVAGIAVAAVGVAAAVVLLRPGASPPRDTTAAKPTETPGVRSPVASHVEPVRSASPASSTAPPAHPSSPSSSPIASVAAASSSASTPRPAAPVAAGDVTACVSRWFQPESFESSADLGFVCTETDGRRGLRSMQRAIVAGGRGLRVSDAMRDWARFRWFELPVYATLRARCCPSAPPIEVPRSSPACPPPGVAIGALGAAAADPAADLDGPMRQYKRVISCLVETGEFPAFGQSGPLGGGEESTFRAFVERGRR